MPLGDQIRHDTVIARKGKASLIPVDTIGLHTTSPKELDEGAVSVDLLRRHLVSARGDAAVELFGIVAKDLGRPRFRGVRVGEKSLQEAVFEHLDAAPAHLAGMAWLGAAQLFEVEGNAERAVHAYGKGIELLSPLEVRVRLLGRHADARQQPQDLLNAMTARYSLLTSLQVRADKKLIDCRSALDSNLLIEAESAMGHAAACPLAPRQQVECLQLGGDIARKAGHLRQAAILYWGAICTAQQHPGADAVDQALQPALQAFEQLRPGFDIPALAKIQDEAGNGISLLDGQALHVLRILAGMADQRPRVDVIFSTAVLRMQPECAREAFLIRRECRTRSIDPHRTKLDLALASMCSNTGHAVDALFYLASALSDPARPPSAEHAYAIAAPLLERFTEAPSARRVSRARDVNLLRQELDMIIQLGADDAVEIAMQSDVSPLLRCVEGFVITDRLTDIAEQFLRTLRVTPQNPGIDHLEQVLMKQMAEETRPDIAALLAPRFELARCHHQLNVQRSTGRADKKLLLDAARQLQRAMEHAKVQDLPLVRECLDTSATIFLMQPRQQLAARAAYFERGATLLAAANPEAVRSHAEEDQRTQVEATLKTQAAFLVDRQRREAESGFEKEGVDALINRARTSISEVIQVLDAP